MDINRLALYLAGKLPPYYRVEYDKLKFIEKVRGISPSTLSAKHCCITNTKNKPSPNSLFSEI